MIFKPDRNGGNGSSAAVVAIFVIFLIIVAAVLFFVFGGQFTGGSSQTKKVDVNVHAPAVPSKSPEIAFASGPVPTRLGQRVPPYR